MIYNLVADTVVVLHLAFIIFIIIGSLLVLKWRRLMLLHIPASIWALLIESHEFLCPLTPLEQKLRILGGENGYSGGFIAHYIEPLVYPAGMSHNEHLLLGMLVFLLNTWVYIWLIREYKKNIKVPVENK